MISYTKRLRAHAPRPVQRPHLRLEELEPRVVPTYSLSGNSWPSPAVITISFVPDGTLLTSNGSQLEYSNLSATLTPKFGSVAAWQNLILKAAQQWAQQANINFSFVSDNGSQAGAGSDQQGDPGMGDIRIGGYAFGNGSLAVAFMPPPVNNYSIAGDIWFNTAQSFNNGFTYDLQSVAEHEFGHALGLYHDTLITSVMYGSYTGVKTTLSSSDTAGIRAIYGARPGDAYDAAASNNTITTASDITSTIDPVALTAVVSNLDITTTSDVDFYTFTAPADTTGTLTVTVQSQGLSMLAPRLTVYAADQQTVLGSASGAGQYGTTLSTTITGVTPGQQFYVKVAGADTTSFGTGAYALTLNFGNGPAPTVPLPNTTLANGNPIHAGGGQPESAGDTFNPTGQEGDPLPAPAAFIKLPAPAAAAQPAAGGGLASPVQTATVLAPGAGGQAALGLPAAGTTAAPATFVLPSGNLGTLPAGANSHIAQASGADDEAAPGSEAARRSDTAPPAAQPEAPMADPAPPGAGPQQPETPPALPQATDRTGAVRADEPCDACFADAALPADSPAQDWEASPSAQAALVAVLLGVYWGERSRPGEDRKRLRW